MFLVFLLVNTDNVASEYRPPSSCTGLTTLPNSLERPVFVVVGYLSAPEPCRFLNCT